MSTVFEGTVTGLMTNFATDLISSLKKKWSIKDKKKRLEEVLILIHSVLDATKGQVIRNASLKRWLRKLKKAADHGDRALKVVKRLLVSEKKSKAGFSVVSPIVTVAAFAKKFLFSGGGGAAIKKLNFALEELETACRNLQVFLRLIELDRSSKKAGFSVRHLHVRVTDKRKKCPPSPQKNRFFEEGEALEWKMKMKVPEINVERSSVCKFLPGIFEVLTTTGAKRKLGGSYEYAPDCPTDLSSRPFEAYESIWDVSILEKRWEDCLMKVSASWGTDGGTFNNLIDEEVWGPIGYAETIHAAFGDGGRKKIKLLEETVDCFSAFEASLDDPMVWGGAHSIFERGFNGGDPLLPENPLVENGEFPENPFVEGNLGEQIA